jgi:hypothetical protein
LGVGALSQQWRVNLQQDYHVITSIKFEHQGGVLQANGKDKAVTLEEGKGNDNQKWHAIRV